MLYTHAGAIPRHIYVWVQPNALGKHDWLRAVWFGLVSHTGRTWGCHVHLECGAVYRNVPLHHLATRADPADAWNADDAQTWDCYGLQFSTIEYPYLAAARARARLRDRSEHDGEYLFTAIPVGDAFTQTPEQAKEFFFLALDNGRITAQPTNQVLIEDGSFTTNISWPTNLRRQTLVHSAEVLA